MTDLDATQSARSPVACRPFTNKLASSGTVLHTDDPSTYAEAGMERRSLARLIAAGLLASSLGCSDRFISPEPPLPTELGVGTTLAPPLTWEARANLATNVRAGAGVADGARIYVLGGSNPTGPTALNRIYNPATNKWTTGKALTGARDFAMAASMSDGIHLLGGAGAAGVLSDHRVYKRSNNTWTTKAPLPLAVDAAVARAINGKLYVIGGGSAAGPANAVQIYTQSSNSWSSGAPMPTPRLSAASGVINGQIFVAGGQIAGIGTTNVLERYDTGTNNWTTLAPMPVAREALGGGVISGQFCVFGGRIATPNPSGNAFPETYCYDPASDTWSQGPNMITPRVEMAFAGFGGALYALGGRSPSAIATKRNERLVVGTAQNRALDYNQSFVSVPDNAALDLIDTWTLEAWVYPRTPATGADQDIIMKWGGGGNASYGLQIDGTGVIRLVTHDGITSFVVLGTKALSPNAWQHVAATFNNGAVNLYLNGVLDQSATGIPAPMNSTQPVAFGREGNFPGGTINGVIDEARLWNIERTGAQILAAKGTRLTGSESGLAAYWRFDEGAGQTTLDATGRGNNGQLGTSSGVDSWDPVWTTNAPVLQ